MRKKSPFPKTEEYIIEYSYNGQTHVQSAVGFKNACDVFRYLRKLYGDNVRMAQVIVNYGGDIL